ncbi:MAG: WbqC family protein [Fuerstiella sp.]
MTTNQHAVAIMQPYFWPYLGYFQLMHNCDQFVLYDNIQYTKKGWINRNRIAENGSDVYVSIPLKKASDYSLVVDREISAEFDTSAPKLRRKIVNAYRRAPFIDDGISIVDECLQFEPRNLFLFLKHSLQVIQNHLGITTALTVASKVAADHNAKGQQKVLNICDTCHASKYINPIGGLHLYERQAFEQHDITLQFLQPQIAPYKQHGCSVFLANLSIIDVLMSCGIEMTRQKLNECIIE